MLSDKKFSAGFDKLYVMASALFAVFTSVPLIWACRYAVPSADDFYGANNMRNLMMEGRTLLSAAWEETIYVYQNTQGTFTGNFVYYFCSALIQAGLFRTRVALFIMTALFLVALYFSIHSIICYILRGGGYKIVVNLLYGCIVFVITIGHNVHEIFYWICGACMYTVPLIFMLAGLAFAVRGAANKRKADILSAMILCGLATGGTLPVAAFCNVILLGIGFWEYVHRRNFKILPVFLCSMAGALINSAAPGNFARQDRIGAELDIILALKNSGGAVLSGFRDLIRNSPLLLIVAICVFIGIRCLRIKIYEILYIVVYSIIGLLLIDFPVVFAYGNIYLEPRVLFVQNMAIVAATMSCSVCIGQTLAWCLPRVQNLQEIYVFVGAAVCLLTVVLMTGGGYGINDIMPLAIYKNIANGNMREFDEENRIIFQLLDEASGQDVVIEYSPSAMGILQPMKLQQSADYWTNVGTAKWYGCNSIILRQ